MGHPHLTDRYGGWTLLEVLTSMAIVFILTGTIGHVGGRQIERAKELAARQHLKVVEIALETYAMDCGVYPTTAQGLDALWTAPVLHPVPSEWDGPYIDGPVNESTLIYRSPGSDGRPYTLRTETVGAYP
jgi:general secretion pathway protein G